MENKMKPIFKWLAAACFLSYVVYACYFNSFGTNAAAMMDFFGISESRQGFVVTIQSIGGLLTAIWLSIVGERYNKIKVITLGMVALAVGALCAGAVPYLSAKGSGYLVFLLPIFIAGVGCTCIDIMVNGVITDSFPLHKNTVLPIAHAFYGSGAMLMPFIVGAIVNVENSKTFGIPLLAVGAASVVATVIMAAVQKRVTPLTPYHDMAEAKKLAAANPAEIFKSGTAWLFLAAGILYFCFQLGTAAWLPTYFQRVGGLSNQLSGLMLTVFFGGALVMRFMSPMFFNKLSVFRTYWLLGLISVACMAVAYSVNSLPVVIPLLAIGGFLQGGQVAGLVIMCCEAFPTRTASASAIVVLAVNLASLFAPLTMGAIAERTGFRLPMMLIVGCALLSILLVALAQRKRVQKTEIE